MMFLNEDCSVLLLCTICIALNILLWEYLFELPFSFELRWINMYMYKRVFSRFNSSFQNYAPTLISQHLCHDTMCQECGAWKLFVLIDKVNTQSTRKIKSMKTVDNYSSIESI